MCVQAKDEDWVYTVRPGDTLWNISQDYLKNVSLWPKIQKYNQIKNPKYLLPGSRLLIPANWLKLPPSPAIVIAISGTAFVYTPSGNESLPIKKGMKIGIRSEIKTEQATTVVLKFADESRLIIQQNAVVILDKLTSHGSNGMVDTRMRLQRGQVDSQVVPFKAKDSRYEITTPAAVASVRGTNFRVLMNSKTGTMSSDVLEGEVAVASQGVTEIIPAGFGTTVIKGKPPLKPERLLSKPDVSLLNSVYLSKSITFLWPELIGASNYRIEIAEDAEFHAVKVNQLSKASKFDWNATNFGKYYLRLRGISVSGIEGIHETHEFSVIRDVPAPRPVSPINDAKVNKQEFTLQWLGHSDAQQFHLQISRFSDFRSVTVEFTGDQQHYSVRKNLEPGLYYWRVGNRYTNSSVGSYSEIAVFELDIQP